MIKSARWQEMLGNANIFATTGNDRLVRVLDARSGPDDAPAVTFADEHSKNRYYQARDAFYAKATSTRPDWSVSAVVATFTSPKSFKAAKTKNT